MTDGRRERLRRARDRVVPDVSWAHGPLGNLVRESAGRLLLGPLMTVYTRRRVAGLEHLRGLTGPVVFVANHASHMDTPAILRALPRRWRRRTMVAAAADYFYRSRLVATAVSLLFNTVPIERRPSRKGGRAINHIDTLLEHGNSLLLFPEGTRNRKGGVGRLRLGAATIAARHRASIVPIYVEGTHRALPPGRRWPRRRHSGIVPRRHDVTITIGPPIVPASSENSTALTARIAGYFEQVRNTAGSGSRSS